MYFNTGRLLAECGGLIHAVPFHMAPQSKNQFGSLLIIDVVCRVIFSMNSVTLSSRASTASGLS